MSLCPSHSSGCSAGGLRENSRTAQHTGRQKGDSGVRRGAWGTRKITPRGPQRRTEEDGVPKSHAVPCKAKEVGSGTPRKAQRGPRGTPKRPRRGPWGEKQLEDAVPRKWGGSGGDRGGSEQLSGCTGAGLGWNTGKWRWGFLPPGPGGCRIHGVDTGCRGRLGCGDTRRGTGPAHLPPPPCGRPSDWSNGPD